MSLPSFTVSSRRADCFLVSVRLATLFFFLFKGKSSSEKDVRASRYKKKKRFLLLCRFSYLSGIERENIRGKAISFFFFSLAFIRIYFYGCFARSRLTDWCRVVLCARPPWRCSLHIDAIPPSIHLIQPQTTLSHSVRRTSAARCGRSTYPFLPLHERWSCGCALATTQSCTRQQRQPRPP